MDCYHYVICLHVSDRCSSDTKNNMFLDLANTRYHVNLILCINI